MQGPYIDSSGSDDVSSPVSIFHLGITSEVYSVKKLGQSLQSILKKLWCERDGVCTNVLPISIVVEWYVPDAGPKWACLSFLPSLSLSDALLLSQQVYHLMIVPSFSFASSCSSSTFSWSCLTLSPPFLFRKRLLMGTYGATSVLRHLLIFLF